MKWVRLIFAGLCLAAFVAASGCGGETGPAGETGGNKETGTETGTETGGDANASQEMPSDAGLVAYDLSLPNMH